MHRFHFNYVSEQWGFGVLGFWGFVDNGSGINGMLVGGGRTPISVGYVIGIVRRFSTILLVLILTEVYTLPSTTGIIFVRTLSSPGICVVVSRVLDCSYLFSPISTFLDHKHSLFLLSLVSMCRIYVDYC